MVTLYFKQEVETRQFRACAMKNIYGRIAEIFASQRKSGSMNMMVTSDLRAEVDIWPFRACALHPDIIIGTAWEC